MESHIKTDQNDELGIAERLVDLLTFKNKRINKLESKIEELESNVEMTIKSMTDQKNEYMSELEHIVRVIEFNEKRDKQAEASKEEENERQTKP